MQIKNLERLMLQLLRSNEAENGQIEFMVGSNTIDNEAFSSSNGFLPLIFLVSQSLETMLGKKEWSKSLLEMQDDEDGILHKNLVFKKDAPTDMPINMIAMTMSASLDMLLDGERNPYVQKDASGVRKIDLVSMVADMSNLTTSVASKALSISPEALERLYAEDDLNMSQKN
jgi:hypothetical protein